MRGHLNRRDGLGKGKQSMKKRGDRIEWAGLRGCEDMQDNHSRQTYQRGVRTFAAWAAEVHGLRYTGKVGDMESLIRDFLADLSDGKWTAKNGRPYSAATISTLAKGACHGFGVDYKLINEGGICPKRTAGRISKGTGRGDDSANPQGRRQAENPKYGNFISLAMVTGARRSELAKIRGRDLIKDESGHLCVLIESGKGGKRQMQRVMEWEEDAVQNLFSGKKPKDFVLSRDEIRNKIDVHYIRAKRSQRCYDHYEKLIREGGADRLRRELIARWDSDHIQGKQEQDRKAKAAFLREIESGIPYRLRGENKQAALAHGRPVEYNRLALMAVSVFCLSHWRLDVTSVNYLSR